LATGLARPALAVDRPRLGHRRLRRGTGLGGVDPARHDRRRSARGETTLRPDPDRLTGRRIGPSRWVQCICIRDGLSGTAVAQCPWCDAAAVAGANRYLGDPPTL
jgi:hypothetical protein